MARYAGSQGKGPKKTKRDKLKASLHYTSSKDENGRVKNTVKRYNDGDDKVTHSDKSETRNSDGSRTVKGKTTITRSESARNPIKNGVKGVKGLPAISRDKKTNNSPAVRKANIKNAATLVKRNGGMTGSSSKTTKVTFHDKKKKKK